MSKTKEVEYDLDDFEVDEIIDHLDGLCEFTREQTQKLKRIINDSEEEYAEEVLKENELYQAVISVNETLLDTMKLELILGNLGNVSYDQIYELFKK
jgi:hypothetical protein